VVPALVAAAAAAVADAAALPKMEALTALPLGSSGSSESSGSSPVPPTAASAKEHVAEWVGSFGRVRRIQVQSLAQIHTITDFVSFHFLHLDPNHHHISVGS
jgi:hypothetical protein